MVRISIITLFLLLFLGFTGFSQSFVNLNFESAKVSAYSPWNDNVPITNALPGWSAYITDGTQTNTFAQVWYNDVSLGGAAISLVDSNSLSHSFGPLAGKYSVILFGGGGPSSSLGWASSISQTAVVPADAKSLLVLASVVGASFTVTLGNEIINMVPVGGVPNEDYGGSIPLNLVGQSETLTFTESPPSGVPPSWLDLDNIQFSSTAIPEPSVFGLSVMGGLFLTWRRWRKPVKI
jgi:hypothetical protein